MVVVVSLLSPRNPTRREEGAGPVSPLFRVGASPDLVQEAIHQGYEKRDKEIAKRKTTGRVGV